MKDKESGESRRKLLKSIAAGSGAIVAGKSLPESWSRPVVDSVMLPAHAQTSPATPPSGGTPPAGDTPPAINGVFTNFSGNGSNDFNLLDQLIPTAMAAPGVLDVCINVNNGVADIYIPWQGTFWAGTAALPISSPLSLTPAESSCELDTLSVTAIPNADGTEISGVQSGTQSGVGTCVSSNPFSNAYTAVKVDIPPCSFGGDDGPPPN